MLHNMQSRPDDSWSQTADQDAPSLHTAPSYPASLLHAGSSLQVRPDSHQVQTVCQQFFRFEMLQEPRFGPLLMIHDIPYFLYSFVLSSS